MRFACLYRWKVSMDSVLPGVASANANMSKCQLFSASCHTNRLFLTSFLLTGEQTEGQADIRERLQLQQHAVRCCSTFKTTWAVFGMAFKENSPKVFNKASALVWEVANNGCSGWLQ